METADRIHIDLRKDGMEAYVRIDSGAPGEEEILRDALEQAGIRFGIDTSILSGLANHLAHAQEAMGEVKVASGAEAEPGEPERLELIHASILQPGTIREDGSLDYRERQLIIPVEQGDPLGRVLPASAGKSGRNVLGESIVPEDPAPLDLKTGEGVIRDSAGVLRAARSGARTLASDGTLDVVDRHVHPGSVNLASGSLRSEGSLEIGGNIEATMIAAASGDIRITGVVDGGCVRARGSVQIGGGAFGLNGGSVDSGGDLEVSHTLGVSLRAKGTLRVMRDASASKLNARAIEVGGRLLGDSAFAEAQIVIGSDAGSPAGGPCWLRVAHPLEGDAHTEASLGNERRPTPVSVRVRPLISRKKSQPKRGRRGRARTSSSKSTTEIEAKLAWRRKQRALREGAFIEVRGKAFAGCRIDFGGKPLVLDETCGPCFFRFDSEQNAIVETET